MSSVTSELHTGIVYATSARAVWEDLRERFDKVNASRIYQLHKDIASAVQGNDSIPIYFSRLRNLWDEFASIVPPPCDCRRSKEFCAHMHRQKLMQFLMGLNETYDQSRSQILMTEPTPSLNKAYAMLVERESQKTMASSSMKGEGTDLTALVARKTENYQNNRGTNYQKGKKNWDQQCDFCKLKGHIKRDCYRLNGYPPDWKFKKKENINTAYNVHTENTHPHMPPETRDNREMMNKMAAGELPRAPLMTGEQHESILQMLDKDPPQHGMMANMAGMAALSNAMEHRLTISHHPKTGRTSRIDSSTVVPGKGKGIIGYLSIFEVGSTSATPVEQDNPNTTIVAAEGSTTLAHQWYDPNTMTEENKGSRLRSIPCCKLLDETIVTYFNKLFSQIENPTLCCHVCFFRGLFGLTYFHHIGYAHSAVSSSAFDMSLSLLL